jgi:hypothetical protein
LASWFFTVFLIDPRAGYPGRWARKKAEMQCEEYRSKSIGDVWHLPERRFDLIVYDERFDEYSINIGDGQQWAIRNCPWCGIPLPTSKRFEWYEALKQLGFDDPDEQPIPEQFRSAAWWKNAQ